ncbi:MAG: type I-C CRISPR-associated protein Cas8c/Csd1 [Planctomycetes bacterium]|nr:type I-C CRISPR-associated protein Cas8c/Csd1 [Planctomycetota bacterium]
MIRELLQLGDRLGLSGHEPFGMRRVHWFVDLDQAGNLVGVSPTVATAKRGKKGEWAEEPGKEYSCPVFFFMSLNKKGEVTATAGGGRAVAELGTGNIAEIWGEQIEVKKGDDPKVSRLPDKDDYKHANFLALHDLLAQVRRHSSTICALNTYLQSNPTFPLEYFKDNAVLKKAVNQQFSFRIDGHPVVADADIREWWKEEYEKRRNSIIEKLPRGNDAFPVADHDDCYGTLTLVFPHVSGVPGGGGWCPLASFDKAPSQSYGLGARTASVRLDVAEKATASLNWLLRDDASHLRMGDAVVIFWAVDEATVNSPPQALNFGELMTEADPLQVREFLEGAWGGRHSIPDAAQFYAAVLSSPQSRITVRSWHTETLPKAVKYFTRWLRLATLPNRFGEDRPTSITQLADCTIRKGKNAKPLPRTYSELFEAALFDKPIPARLYLAVLERQSLELAIGSDRKTRTEFEDRLHARTALIRLYSELTKKGDVNTMENHTEQTDAAYLCGRLLAMLDKIHIEAHKESGGTNSSPANRSYAAASTTPALAFPQLCKLARYHLNKIGGGWANCLEHGYKDKDTGEVAFEGLKHVCARLQQASDCSFPRTLSLEEQGRFAIGFYYERCRQWPKREKTSQTAETAESEPNTQQ